MSETTTKGDSMTNDQYRGILTEREKEILQGEADVSEDYEYRVVSRIRSKIEKVEEDIEVLKEHDSDLADELRDTVSD
jgi:hypothetical protein